MYLPYVDSRPPHPTIISTPDKCNISWNRFRWLAVPEFGTCERESEATCRTLSTAWRLVGGLGGRGEGGGNQFPTANNPYICTFIINSFTTTLQAHANV